MLKPQIDWPSLARKVGSLSEQGELGGREYAQRALSKILGDSEIVAAVHAFISLDAGSELASNVLALLRPASAIKECARIFRESTDLHERRLAIALLGRIADRKVLKWADEIIRDPDVELQTWGARLIEELTYLQLIEEEEIEDWLVVFENHDSDSVRQIAKNIRRTCEMAQ